MKWNSIVGKALFYQVPKKHIKIIKDEKILKVIRKFGKLETIDLLDKSGLCAQTRVSNLAGEMPVLGKV